ncbi:MAG: glycosyltransferase [Actinomycetota bacterium]|nr:glycosyltransferase [Actinomycetota bacterium]
MTAWPSVGVVVPTYNRPGPLRTALTAVLGQDYPGRLRAVIVYDRAEPDMALADGDRVMVTANARTPGLAGARNTGIGMLNTDLIAFCDDDDEWLPGKLRRQVEALRARPTAEFASCGIMVDYAGARHSRLAGRAEVTHADLLRSRMVMVHSSTYLMWREALTEGIGLVDETIPGSQNEDWDLVLRAARRHPIVHVDEPLVRVVWGASSHYTREWQTKADSLHWMLQHHPEIAACRPGAARVYAQLSFAYACLRQRGDAYRWAWRALRSNWHERRVPFALAVAVGIVPGDTVLRQLNGRGHGI